MINRFSFLVLIFLALNAQIFAQDYDDEDVEDVDKTETTLVNKKGFKILPEEGDFAIGVNAVPYFEYLGNFFGKTGKNTLSINDFDIFGRYYIDNESAIRFNIYINNKNKYENRYVQDDVAVLSNPASNAQVKDTRNTKDNAYGLMAGYQRFRGYGRLRGFYGGQLGYVRSRKRIIYNYGNSISQTNQNPTISDLSAWTGNARPLSNKQVATNNVVLGAFAGVEYYFAPKICIGAEVRLNAILTFSGETKVKNEYWNGTKVGEKETVLSPGDMEVQISSFGHGNKAEVDELLTPSNTINDFSAATIYLMFTF